MNSLGREWNSRVFKYAIQNLTIRALLSREHLHVSNVLWRSPRYVSTYPVLDLSPQPDAGEKMTCKHPSNINSTQFGRRATSMGKVRSMP